MIQVLPTDSSPEGEKDRQYVTALARGLQILRCFSHDKPELTPQEIVRMTGLPQPTVWRLCHTLSKEGFIICAGENNRMALGLPALALGYAALVRQSLPRIALPHMQALTDSEGMGMSLAVRDGLDMLYIQRTHGDFVYMNDPVGARRPFASAPTGWACFAGYDDQERETVLLALEQHEPKAFPALRAQLEHSRAQFAQHGFVTSLGIIHEHLNAVAVPIRSLRSGTVYALSASGLAADWPQSKLEAIGHRLVQLARQLEVAAD
ncbi:DNA-binding IclR family transcriptional regulator [Pseudomonas lini]|jgi:DNA-binding IclR family transcriptional regulator|uniref:IclR family transcriptional regulator n=1 Tax=Pseudomonas lini TaxID=163011 RepID=UPI00277FE46D|nr:IclR family transcriptional regulator [Pseudomonas lini]MDQ0124825.1 DNA-binding IclR family transcriptional regulator [Pseudomonas lini]